MDARERQQALAAAHRITHGEPYRHDHVMKVALALLVFDTPASKPQEDLPSGSPPRRYKCFWKDETGLHVTHKSATLLQVIHLTDWQDEEIEQLINLRVGQRWEDALPGEHATGQSAFERIS